jgi:hypothetical protein
MEAGPVPACVSPRAEALASRGTRPGSGRPRSPLVLLASLLLLGSVAVVAGGCSAGADTSPAGDGGGEKVAAGVWGGEHAGVTVTQDGAVVEFDCAHGEIGARLLLDDSSRFDLPGTFVLEQGGPVRPGQILPTSEARYRASIDGRRMRLEVTLVGTGERIGAFELVLGESPRLLKCL